MAPSLDIDLGPLLARPGASLHVGLSGGLDSCVLLHALATDARISRRALRAVHVHHGLQSSADAWQAHAAVLCASLDVPFEAVRVQVTRGDGGLEAAARAARHAALRAAAAPGDVVALAHHLDDQAETFLLRALRGSGPEGLGAMRAWRAFGDAWLWRPLLDVPRATLEAYARAHGLAGVADPSNADAAFDRNFLRLHVLPLLATRWPHAAAALSASARRARDAADLLAVDDALALDACRLDDGTLSIPALRSLPATRRARVLRRWVDACGLPPLPAIGVARIDADLLHARPDARARFDWSGACIRAWNGRVHAARAAPRLDPALDIAWDGMAPLALPDGASLALSPALALPAGTRVRARRGGERIRLPGRTHRHALKHVLQDARLPPWVRARLPLLVLDDEVLAAGDVVVGATLAAHLAGGPSRLVWTPPPAA